MNYYDPVDDPDPEHPGFNKGEHDALMAKWARQRRWRQDIQLMIFSILFGVFIGYCIWGIG